MRLELVREVVVKELCDKLYVLLTHLDHSRRRWSRGVVVRESLRLHVEPTKECFEVLQTGFNHLKNKETAKSSDHS